jgi:ankyrin repeat protein
MQTELFDICVERDPDPADQRRRIAAALKRGVDIHAADKNGVTALHHAVRFRSPAAVQTLLEQGASANQACRRNGSTPLHRAVTQTGAPETAGRQQAAIEIIKLLLAAGADPSIKNKLGRKPIDYVTNDQIRLMLMSKPTARRPPSAPRMTQPEEMKNRRYVCGVEPVDGNDAWALFKASARGDVPRVKALLAKDRRLANAQFWYQLPIHLAVYAGHDEVVRQLLKGGADPGQSVYTYNSWDKLLACARQRGFQAIVAMLEGAIRQRFCYSPDFDLLKQAIVSRDARRIRSVLRRRPDLGRASDALGNNAIHWSVITRQLAFIRQFARLGLPIDQPRADGQTPLLLAVNGGTDYWFRDTRGRTHPSLRNVWVMAGSLLALGAEYSISAACAVGDQERVEELLRHDAGLAKRLDSARISPLSYAAREGHLHIVQQLLEHGADPNQPEDACPEGRALFEACCGNHLKVAEVLLEHGANPNAGSNSNGCCLTIGEVYFGARAKPMQDLLRRYGAYTPPYAMTAAELKQAIREGHEVVRHDEFLGNVMRQKDPELVDLLLDSDPSVLERMEYHSGMVYPRSTELVKKLLARGLDPNRPDWLGKTFLHACAENGGRAAAGLFLNAGADINAREVAFQGTPLAAAVRAHCAAGDAKQAGRLRKMVEFLLKRGAATQVPGEPAWATPLAWAERAGNGEMVELLKQYGG